MIAEAKPPRADDVMMRSIVRAEIETKWSLRRREGWVQVGLITQIEGFEESMEVM